METLLMLAQAAPVGSGGSFSLKGLLVFVVMVVVFVGSVWLLLSMILGPKLGYFVMGACLMGVLIMLSGIWFVTGLGPKGADGFLGHLGEETAWQAVFAGESLHKISTQYGSFDVSDYPNGGWQKPSGKGHLADLKGDATTSAELEIAKPVMEGLVLSAISPIPGVRAQTKSQVQGPIALTTGNFSLTDVRMKETKVRGKDSIIAEGRVVPTATVPSGDLGGATEGKVTKFLAKQGDQLQPGQPLMEVTTDKGVVQLTSDKPGRLVTYGFRIGDKIKPNVAFATVDVSGQPGVPAPVEVAAVRVRGSVKTPAFIYLVAFVTLFVLHLAGVRRIEEELRTTQPQTA
jgi:hypothetical protein